jgi:hypothetical protein
MRLNILNGGHSFGMKVLFAFLRAVSRLPVPDAIKLNRYRPDFYGTPMGGRSLKRRCADPLHGRSVTRKHRRLARE